jgi:hypothetical protein
MIDVRRKRIDRMDNVEGEPNAHVVRGQFCKVRVNNRG